MRVSDLIEMLQLVEPEREIIIEDGLSRYFPVTGWFKTNYSEGNIYKESEESQNETIPALVLKT